LFGSKRSLEVAQAASSLAVRLRSNANYCRLVSPSVRNRPLHFDRANAHFFRTSADVCNPRTDFPAGLCGLIDATRNLLHCGTLLFDSRRDRTGDSVNLSDFLSDLSYRCGRRKQRRP
jgi:hypothetical protein